MTPLLPDVPRMAAALAETAARDGAFLPLLDEAARLDLLRSTEGLRYRPARPLVGPAGREVRQDFELTMTIPEPHPLRDLAGALTDLILRAAATLAPNPLPQGLLLNDLIVQRYHAGSAGITPHRDHIRYVGLVALVTLEGQARFLLCDDRGGANPRPIGLAPGGLTLMRAPGFAGRHDRPFHCVIEVTEPRVSLGLRQDTRPGEPT